MEQGYPMKKRTVYIIHSGHDHDSLYIKGIKEGWGEERWKIVAVNYRDEEEIRFIRTADTLRHNTCIGIDNQNQGEGLCLLLCFIMLLECQG